MSAEVQEEAAVLVVDDNPLIVNVLKSLFAHERFHVFSSSNGEEALNVLGQKRIDVIVCDVMMPTMDGYRLHETVRGKPELAHIPFVFLTALSDRDEKNRGKEVGADDYLTKPFDPRELLSVVKGKVVRSKGLKGMSEERYDSYRRKVIHTLSHEFRTPLVAINTGTELLLEQNPHLDKNRVVGLLEAIRRGGQRLEKLVNDFMMMQQIEAGVAERVFQQRAEVRDISKVLGAYFERKRPAVEAEGFTLTINDGTEGARVKVYEAQLEAVLDRLLGNAMKFGGDNKVIEVVVFQQLEEVVIEVRDRGIGLDVKKVQEAIDVFGQVDREKLEQQGGGLGLAISSRYLSFHGGKIDFENRPGGGTIVSIILPRAQ